VEKIGNGIICKGSELASLKIDDKTVKIGNQEVDFSQFPPQKFIISEKSDFKIQSNTLNF
jgi:hypothetical protein